MALPEDLISLEDCAEDAGPYISEDHSLVKNKLKTQHHKKNQEMLLQKGEGYMRIMRLIDGYHYT